jgi:heme exporter protein A
VARTATAQRHGSPATDVTAPAVAVRGLWREFGDRAVLRDVSVELGGGGTLTVLGPNGAGKTTLLRVLATLLRPNAGQVSVLGCALPGQAWKARGRIGYLGHRPLLYRDLTCAENLRFHARLHGLAGDTAGRIAKLLDAVRMSRWADHVVRSLSAGMVQRVEVCRAVLHQPELLLLDEPGSHLDPEAAALVEQLVGRESGRSRVLVTHDVDTALAEGDVVLALRAGGGVAYEGPASGLSAGDARAIYRGAP